MNENLEIYTFYRLKLECDILKLGVHGSLSRKAKLISKVYWKHMSMDYEMDEY